METVSQRLADTTDRLDKVLDDAKVDIAVQRERLDNHDDAIQGISDAIKQHQDDDRSAHKEMNDKLDGIKSAVDQLTGAASKDTPANTFWTRLMSMMSQWKYAILGGMFVAGALTHKAHFFEWLLKFFVDNG